MTGYWSIGREAVRDQEHGPGGGGYVDYQMSKPDDY
jgi:hypothetical protein